MEFNNDFELEIYLRQLKEIGRGSQGVAYLSKKSKIVVKIYHEFFDKFYPDYEEEDDFLCPKLEKDILRFKDIKCDTFSFPRDTIKVNGEVLGHIASYKPGKLLYKSNPLLYKFDNIITASGVVISDIQKLASCKIRMYDVSYNTLYDGKKISIIDTDEYTFSEASYDNLLNHNTFCYSDAIYDFLFSGLFEEFIISKSDLWELYNTRGLDPRTFLTLFKKYAQEHIGDEMNYLRDAKKLINKRPHKNQYQREIIRKL